ncbi:MAG: putative ATP-dependent endonuclease of OLD family [Ulvibacter sp.]|jgi:putative ATP-dependent endonuclease of OLD family
MTIEKVNIENYKCFEGKFSIDFNQGLNILVGDNEAGKSTILEAINLALTGMLGGRYLKYELSQYLFNNKIVSQYVNGIKNGTNPHLPHISIEVFFKGDDHPTFEGNGNSEKTKKSGIVYKIEFNPEYQSEYESFIANAKTIETIPIEYYRVICISCARELVTPRSIPIKSVLIDSTSTKYQNGSDVYLSRIIQNDLDDNEKVQLSQAYRKMKESFMEDSSIQAINLKLNSKEIKPSEKNLTVSVDLSTQNSWETTLMTYLEEVPFHQIGKGEQCIIKTNLALGHKKSKEANLILLEEPENHLSHTKLNELVTNIVDGCIGKQLIISTHSSFIANKLGLENLLLLNDFKVARLSKLSKDTYKFFKKLPGYQTLRLLLCRKVVLVEGNSDELIFQRAYMDKHEGHLPIEDGIDVVSVNLTFLRFLEIANMVNQPVAVITDNDGNFAENITKKYKDYEEHTHIKIFADKDEKLNTLEPQFVEANIDQLTALRTVLKITKKAYPEVKNINKYMIGNKTEWALKVFESEMKVNYPKYMLNAVEWCDA